MSPAPSAGKRTRAGHKKNIGFSFTSDWLSKWRENFKVAATRAFFFACTGDAIF